MSSDKLLINIQVPFEDEQKGIEWFIWLYEGYLSDDLFVYGKRKIKSSGSSTDETNWKPCIFRGKHKDCFDFVASLIGKNLSTSEISDCVNVGIYSVYTGLPVIFNMRSFRETIEKVDEERDELVFYENVKLNYSLFSEFTGYLQKIRLGSSITPILI